MALRRSKICIDSASGHGAADGDNRKGRYPRQPERSLQRGGGSQSCVRPIRQEQAPSGQIISAMHVFRWKGTKLMPLTPQAWQRGTTRTADNLCAFLSRLPSYNGGYAWKTEHTNVNLIYLLSATCS